jgi:hypothetical protein
MPIKSIKFALLVCVVTCIVAAPTFAVSLNYNVFFLDTNQHIAHLVQSPGGWTSEEIPSFTYPLGTALFGLAGAGNTNANIFCLDPVSRHLTHVVWSQPTGWHQEDLTAITGAPLAPVSFGGMNTLTVTGFLAPDGSVSAFYGDTNQHIALIKWSSSTGWRYSDVTVLANAPLMNNPDFNLAVPSHITGYFAGNENVYYLSSNQHLQHLYYSNGWHDEDLTNIAGVGVLAQTSPLASFAIQSPTSHHMWYIGLGNGSNLHLREVNWSSTQGWKDHDVSIDANWLFPLTGPISAFHDSAGEYVTFANTSGGPVTFFWTSSVGHYALANFNIFAGCPCGAFPGSFTSTAASSGAPKQIVFLGVPQQGFPADIFSYNISTGTTTDLSTLTNLRPLTSFSTSTEITSFMF